VAAVALAHQNGTNLRLKQGKVRRLIRRRGQQRQRQEEMHWQLPSSGYFLSMKTMISFLQRIPKPWLSLPYGKRGQLTKPSSERWQSSSGREEENTRDQQKHGRSLEMSRGARIQCGKGPECTTSCYNWGCHLFRTPMNRPDRQVRRSVASDTPVFNSKSTHRQTALKRDNKQRALRRSAGSGEVLNDAGTQIL